MKEAIKKKTVVVATYTNEGLKIGLMLGPLKFEPRKRGRQPKLPVPRFKQRPPERRFLY